MLRVGIDVGGTFTDLFAWEDGGSTGGPSIREAKVLTTPDDPSQGVMEALRVASIDLKQVDTIIHGTTIGTNALLTRRFPEPAMITRPRAPALAAAPPANGSGLPPSGSVPSLPAEMTMTMPSAVSIITMIHFASVNLHWTWLWYVAVIALGAAMLTLFALFEKKKSEMLALVDGLKSWQ